MTPMADSQRGVALLTVLLLVVSIMVVAGSMLASQKIAIRRSSLVVTQDQLLQGIAAGKQLAVTIIRADNQLNDTDSAQDIWAQPLPPYMLGNHSITIELRDEASRFNINNLYHNAQVDSSALAIFQRLLLQLNLEPDIAIAVLDWQDADNEVYNDGGDESTVYANNTLPNQPFISVEQLQEVRGVDAQVLATLRPYITAIPYYLPININTASPVLLAALVDEASSEQLQALMSLREQQVLTAVSELWQLPPLSALDAAQQQALAPILSVDSQAFMALITASDNDSSGAKRRFATVLIAKTQADRGAGSDDNADNNTNKNTDNNTNTNNSTDKNRADNNTDEANPKEVKVISQRLWAFRPRF